MPKINIYVPDEMKARMDGAETTANWSAIAQRAFESELNHLERIKEVKSMSDVIERLRGSKQNKAEELQKQGRERGVDWAKHSAEYDELRRASQTDTNELDQAIIVGDPDEAYRDWVARHILAGSEWDAYGWDERWELTANLFGVDEDMLVAVVTTEFIEGFLEGAADVWDQVKGEI